MGMWWGAVLLVYLPQWSTSLSGDFKLGNGANAYLATIIFGVVLIVVMMAAPTGIQGGLRVGGDGSVHWLRPRRASPPIPTSWTCNSSDRVSK